jgi:hypothetical protein
LNPVDLDFGFAGFFFGVGFAMAAKDKRNKVSGQYRILN